MAKKQTKDKATATKILAKQGNSQVGYGNPPKEYQFKPGESGNLKGPPKGRVQLWTYICRFMAMTDEQLNRAEKKKMTIAEQWALRIIKNTRKLGFATLDRFARYVIDRDEGKPTEHVLVGDENTLTDAECEEIRGLLKNHAD
ncbi:MAG: hypothetical protein ACYS4W_07345 [Planctomycetota bacterium]|jgi:hypothetical protein